MQAAAFQVASCIVFYVRTQSRIPAFYWLTIKLRPNALTTCLGLIHAGMFSYSCGDVFHFLRTNSTAHDLENMSAEN